MSNNINYYNLPYTSPTFEGESLYFKFKSWSQFQSNLSLRISKNINFSHYSSSRQQKEGDFNDTDSLDEAILRLSSKVEPTKSQKKELFEVQKKASRMYLSDTPFDGIDIPNFLSNSNSYWINFSPAKRHSPKKLVKNIFIMVNALCYVTADELNDYLAKSLIDIYSNYIFEKVVICTLSSYSSEEINQIYIDISYREVMLIFRCGYSDFFRRVCFFVKEQHTSLPDGYGSTLDLKSAEQLLSDKRSKVFCYHS